MTAYEDLPKWDGDRSTPETPHWNFNHLPCRVNFDGSPPSKHGWNIPFFDLCPRYKPPFGSGLLPSPPKKSSAGSPGPGRVRKPRAAMIEEGDLEIDGVDGIDG